MVAYAALRELIPVFPVYALLFTDAGLSTSQVSSLFVIWSATHVVLEVPSGAWADTVPRRRLLVLGAAVYAACFALWTAVPTYAAFAAGFVLWGLSGSLVSGTYEAYVYDHLARPRRDGVVPAGDRGGPDLGAGAQPRGHRRGGTDRRRLGPRRGRLGQRAGLRRRDRAWPPPCRLTRRARASTPRLTRTQPDLGYLAMLRAGLAESLHPRLARAVLLAAAVPAFLAFDEYFGLLAVDLGATLASVPLLVALTVAAQAVGAALAPRLPLHRLGPGRWWPPACWWPPGRRRGCRRASWRSPSGTAPCRPPSWSPRPTSSTASRAGARHRDLGERAAQRARRDRALRVRRPGLGGRDDGD